MLKKIFLIIIAVLAIWFFIRFVIGGPEDTWICENGQWVKHGAPSAPMPNEPCSEIETKNGDKFFVILNSNPTTGYQWELDFDPNYIQLVDRKYIPRSPEIVGSGGDETFNFLALKSGETEITFSYLRSWEEKSPIEKKVYEIIIK